MAERKAQWYDHMASVKAKSPGKDFNMFPIYSETRINDEYMFVQMETQGWRVNMEDAIMIKEINGPNGIDRDYLLGIFDGHGGHMVSLFCKVVVPRIFDKIMKSMIDNDSLDDS